MLPKAMGYERNNCFTKIQLVGQKNVILSELRQNAIQAPLLWFSKQHFSLLVGYNMQLSSSSTNQNALLKNGQLAEFY